MGGDEVPTARSSGTIAVFRKTVDDAIERLNALPAGDEVAELRREAGALRALFTSWEHHAPVPDERTRSIARLMDLHRAVEELATRR